jgi:putative isomerase
MITPAGWNTWDVRTLNGVVHLPDALRIRFTLIDPRDNTRCDEFGWRLGLHRIGPHATDGSYCQIDLKWNQTVVRFEYATDGDRLVCRVTPLETRFLDALQSNAESRFLVAAELDGAWKRTVQTQRNGDTWVAIADGKVWLARSTNSSQAQTDAAFTFKLNEAVLVQVEPQATAAPALPDTAELSRWVDERRAACLITTLTSDGWLQDSAAGLTRSIAWNTIWEPIKGRVCTPVSRDWCKDGGFGSYVLFDWDTFFCAVMANLEDPALAEANARAILQEVTSRGFVPNFGCELGPSEDRSQPPVGAYCILKIARSSSLTSDVSRALLAETFAALLRWHAWWPPARDGNGDGLLEWGSDPLPEGLHKWEWNNMQAAMYESGLDNSPMYDDAAFNITTHTMELADVGLNALYAMDAWALAEIATELGRTEDAQRLSAEYRQLADLINREMWDEQAGIYKNRHWDGRLSPHLSPTNFYPLIAGIAPPERAARMVHEHLLNEREFWGRYVIPSTARDDPGYGGNDYWRGRIWGPMNFLVSEGLRRYRFDAQAHEFAKRGLDLFLGEWQAESHVHENFNSDTGDGDDMPNSDPMYTWGALLAYIAAQELADAEPWAGWRFGNLSGEAATLRNLRVAEGMLDIEMSAAGLSVRLNGVPLIASDQPALITRCRRENQSMGFHITPRDVNQMVMLTLGSLPPGTAVRIEAASSEMQRNTSATGEVQFPLSSGAVSITWAEHA